MSHRQTFWRSTRRILVDGRQVFSRIIGGPDREATVDYEVRVPVKEGTVSFGRCTGHRGFLDLRAQLDAAIEKLR